jgi:hypothetical protein
MAVDELALVQPGEGVHYGPEHFFDFFGREGTLAKNFGEDFFGILGDNVEQINVVDVTAPVVEEAHEVRMRQVFGRFPLCEAGF